MDIFERFDAHERGELCDGLTCDIGSLVGAAGGIVSGIMGAGAAKDAAAAQEAASQSAQNTVNAANSTVQQGYQPYTATGTSALKALNGDLSSGTGFAAPFNMSSFYSDPGYQFTLQQGQNAVNSSAAAKGQSLSGGTLKALDSYTSGLANTTYGDAYNRYLQSSQQRYSQLTGLAGLGLQAQTGSANSTLSTAKQDSDLITGAGNAQAAGIIGAQNSYNSAIGAVTGAGQQYSLNNSLSAKPLSLLGQVL